MAQDIVNLEAFKAQRTIDPDLDPNESLAGGIGTSYGIIGYKGKTWSLRKGGETHLFKNAKGELSQSINVVVLHAAPGKSKSYFPSYDEGSGDPPLCASIDGITPDVGVEQQQAEACAICPHNELKTLPNGRKGKECTDYKRLAVALMPNVTALMFGEPMLEPVFLRVPPASLNSLAMLEQRMGPKGLGYHYSAYLTRISFVALGKDGKPMAYPQMEFYAVRPLEPNELVPIKDMRNDPQCQRITGEGGSQRALAGPTSSNVNLGAFAAAKSLPNPAQAKTLELTPNQPSAAVTGQPTAPVAVAPSEDEGTGLGSAPAKQPGAPTVSHSEDTGLGITTQVTTAAPTQQPQTTVADTGEPEESDAELDARIAGIINKAK